MVMSPCCNELACSTFSRSLCEDGLNVVGMNSTIVGYLLGLRTLVLLRFLTKSLAGPGCWINSTELLSLLLSKKLHLGVSLFL